MPEINLLENESRSTSRFHLPEMKKGSAPFYVAIGLLIVTALVYGAFFLMDMNTQKQLTQTEKTNNDVNLAMAGLTKAKDSAVALQTQISNTDTLLLKHIYWTEILKELEKYSYNKIVFNTLTMDQANRRLVLSGITPTNTDLGKFMLGLKKSPMITDLTLESVSTSQKEIAGYVFSMTITFDTAYLEKNAKK